MKIIVKLIDNENNHYGVFEQKAKCFEWPDYMKIQWKDTNDANLCFCVNRTSLRDLTSENVRAESRPAGLITRSHIEFCFYLEKFTGGRRAQSLPLNFWD